MKTPAARLLVMLVLAGWGLGLSAARAVPTPVVQAVRIESVGGLPVDEPFVRSVIGLREGQEFDRMAVMADVRALEKSGHFSMVAVSIDETAEGMTVIYKVQGKPRIRRIEVVGADYLGNKKVAELMALELGELVDDGKMAAGALKVQQEYQKKYHPRTRVTWALDLNESTGQADVRVEVKEGPKARVRSIDLAGCETLDVKEVLKTFKQKKYHWYNPWHWVSGAGRYNGDDTEADAYALKRAYLDRGYLDVQVSDARVELAGPRALHVSYTVREGRVYRIGNVAVEDATLYAPELLLKQCPLLTGEVASMKKIEDAQDALADYYGNRGYIMASADRQLDPDAATGLVDVTFRMREGSLSSIRDIKIRGNVITQDRVLRRELVVYPGEEYNRARVRTSERRLQNLGYFSSVHSYPEQTPDPAQHDLVFDVKEQSMGQAAVGMGFSSIDEISGYMEISHGNFCLGEWPPVGGGQKIKLRTIIGTQRKDVEFSFIEPWLFDRKLSLGVDLFHSEKSYLSSEYDQRNTGGRLSLSRAVGRFSRLRLSYGLENIDIYNVSDDASERIREEEGARIKSYVDLTLTRDTRDSAFLPTRGNLTQTSVMFAGGPLMGDTDIYQLESRSTQFVPLWFGHVLSLKGQAGVVDTHSDADRVPIFDRYFLGGANTIRGFKYRKVGPVDENEEPLGGSSMVFGSLEYTVPVMNKVRFATFYDAGMVWPDAYEFKTDFNSSYGVGLRLDIPMLPLRLDYSWPLETSPHNDRSSGRFSFMIGYGF